MSAQIWDYSDGNATFTTQIDLAAALPLNGTVDVTPQSVNFSGIGLDGFTSPYGYIFEPGFVGTPVFAFTTQNGSITAFDMALSMTQPGTNSPTNLMITLSSNGDSFFEQLTGFQCAREACNPLTATSAPGTWTDPPVKAPEFGKDFASLFVLAFCLAILVAKTIQRGSK